MKTFVLVSTVVCALFAGEAIALCSETAGWKKMTTAGSGGSLAISTLTGKTVCVGSAGNWDAQEFHQSGGALKDYKKGPSDTVDPTSQVGTWSPLPDQISYTYGPTVYIYDVYEKTGSYSFCVGGSEKAAATIRTGQVAC